MKLSRTPRRTPPETIIALIDVVFFLLIFFMLVGRMDATAPFDVLPPVAQTGVDMPGGGVTVSVASDGALALERGSCCAFAPCFALGRRNRRIGRA